MKTALWVIQCILRRECKKFGINRRVMDNSCAPVLKNSASFTKTHSLFQQQTHGYQARFKSKIFKSEIPVKGRKRKKNSEIFKSLGTPVCFNIFFASLSSVSPPPKYTLVQLTISIPCRLTIIFSLSTFAPSP